MATSKLAYLLKALTERKREYIMQIIPVKHELWLAGITTECSKEYLNLVKMTLEETNPKPIWAAEVLHIINQ
jgi:ribonuclease HII